LRFEEKVANRERRKRHSEGKAEFGRLALVLFLIICFGCQGSMGAYAGSVPATGDQSLRTLLADPVKREELTGYAEGVFLARLGMGREPAPPPWTGEIQAACFVTFFSGKRVVACAGGFHPRTRDLGREVAANVGQALRIDPRARGMDRRTALSARVLITFPSEPRPVASYAGIDPVRQGLFVENDRFGVAIVPGEAKTASWAYREAVRRLGEKDPAAVRLYAFEAWGVKSPAVPLSQRGNVRNPVQ
jgi:hypothetical protein